MDFFFFIAGFFQQHFQLLLSCPATSPNAWAKSVSKGRCVKVKITLNDKNAFD